MDILALLNLALAVVSIATLAGLGLLRGTVTNLREQLRDERELAAVRKERDKDNRAQVERLKHDLAALSRVVTAEVHWTAIGELLDHHHAEARTHWNEERDIWIEIRDQLREAAKR